jgi:hypothetical protein
MPGWAQAAMGGARRAARWAGGTQMGASVGRALTSAPAIRSYVGAGAGAFIGGARGALDENVPFWGGVGRGMMAGAASGLLPGNRAGLMGLGATALGASATDIGLGYGAYRGARAGLGSFMRGFNAPRQMGLPGIAPPPATGFRGTRAYAGLSQVGRDSASFIGNTYTRAANGFNARVNRMTSRQMSFNF